MARKVTQNLMTITLKVVGGSYSQWVGREKLFERERSTDPNWHYWNVCASASDQLGKA